MISFSGIELFSQNWTGISLNESFIHSKNFSPNIGIVLNNNGNNNAEKVGTIFWLWQ
jgi:hypothetical protein